KVLFATHYHELQTLEKEFPSRIKNFHMAVTEQNGDPIFLHTLLPGGASHSFGVSVAKLAGIPERVIERAKNVLENLEQRNIIDEAIPEQKKVTGLHTGLFEHLLVKELEQLDIATMTPLEALNTIAKLKEKLSLVKEQQSLREAD